MSTAGLKRWMLVNYVGYPFAPNSLMPDNGLANLAGVLIEAGHSVRIVDLATVSVLEKFTSPALSRRLQRAWDAICPLEGRRPGGFRKLAALCDLLAGEAHRSRLGQAAIREIAARLSEEVVRHDVQAVGFKLWNGDGLGGSACIAGRIRRACPNIKIFGGGPQVDFFRERILERYPVFDALVFGEGEETIGRLAESGADPRSYESIPNLIYSEDGAVRSTQTAIVRDLDALPHPVYDEEVYPAMRGDEKIRILVLDESRGCRNHCAFCIHPIKSDHNLRTKSVSRLLAEVDRMRERVGVHTFRFAGSCTPYGLLNDFARALGKRDPGCVYSSFAHVRDAKTADFGTIRASGCVALFFGIESGSPEILGRLRKGITPADIREAVIPAAEAGITTVGSVIYPAPGETDATTRETLELLRGLPLGAVNVTSPLVVPRSDWFNRPERYGIAFQRERYMKAALDWKIKILLPPSLWKSLPVSVDGRSFKQILAATSSFLAQVERMGFTVTCPDDLCLMSHRAGMDLRAFRDESRAALFVGDAARVRTLVRKINANA